MDIERYLKRIAYTGRDLRGLHRQHLLTVPFENLDIGKRPIVIDEEAFVQKIAGEGRGGFCYELNGAFSALLRALGYKVTLLSARVGGRDGTFSPEFDHLALHVVDDHGEAWLADVGFGDNFLEPLRLVPDLEQSDREGVFVIKREGDAYLLERDGKAQYRFTLTPHPFEDFAPRCRWHQTSPESHFMTNVICSRATEDGRITLSGLRLITTSGKQRTERDLKDDEEWRAALRQHFGVRLPPGYGSRAATSAG